MAQPRSSVDSTSTPFLHHAHHSGPTSMEPGPSARAARSALIRSPDDLRTRPDRPSPRSTPRSTPRSLSRQDSWQAALPDVASALAHSPAQRVALPKHPLHPRPASLSAPAPTMAASQLRDEKQPPRPLQPPAAAAVSPSLSTGSSSGFPPTALTTIGDNVHGRAADDEKPIKRRMRGITSCLECRRRKTKCGRTQPCNHCIKSGAVCIYIGDRLDPENRGRITEIKEKVSSLELQLQQSVVVQQQQKQRSGDGLLGSDTPAYALSNPDNDLVDGLEGVATWATAGANHDLEINGIAISDLTYDHALEENDESNHEHTAQTTDDMIDLGFKIGRLRVTERTGGLGRLRMAGEVRMGQRRAIEIPIQGNREDEPTNEKTDAISQNGPSTPACRSGQAMGLNGASGDCDDYDDDSLAIPGFLRPSQGYLPPTSGVLFDQCTVIPPVQKLLPSMPICDFLKDSYFTSVHLVAPCLHRPTFEQQYDTFFGLVGRGLHPRRTLQALVLAVLFSGVVAASPAEIDARFDIEKLDLVASLKCGVEASLGKTNLLRTASIEVMQAFVIYLITLCRDEVSRAHSVLVGTAIRMAECMGLHRDGSTFGLTPLATQVRRLVWHQLCFLDLRTSEAQASRPIIHREDYDTCLPYNCNDDSLVANTDPISFASQTVWTTSLLAVLRFEVNEMVRAIWHERLRLQKHRSHLPIIIAKIGAFRLRLNEKYEDCLDDSIPIKQYTRLLLELFVCRMYIMVLHPYHASATQPLPEPLRTCLVQNGIRIVEIGKALETRAEFSQWRWYHGALTSYQVSLLLAFEALHEPDATDANRIGHCLDYVFGTNPTQNLQDKANSILSEAIQKAAIYDKFRRLRTPMMPGRPKQSQPPAEQARIGQIPSPNTPQRSQWSSPANAEGLWSATAKRSSPSDESSYSSLSSPPSPAAETLRLAKPSHEVLMEDASATRGLAFSSYHDPLLQLSTEAQEHTQLQHRQQLYAQWQHYQSLQESMDKEMEFSGALPFSPGGGANHSQQQHLPPLVPPPAVHSAGTASMVFSSMPSGEALYYVHPQSGCVNSTEEMAAEWPASTSPAFSSPQLLEEQRYQQHPQYLQHPQQPTHSIDQVQHSFYVPARGPYAGSEPGLLNSLPMDD